MEFGPNATDSGLISCTYLQIPKERNNNNKKEKDIGLEGPKFETKIPSKLRGLTGKGSCQVAPTMEGLTIAMLRFSLSCCTTISPKALV